MADNATAKINFTRKAEKPDTPSCVAQTDRRSYLLLVPTLIAACLTLLISTVYLRATCRRELNTPSNGSEMSCSSDRSEVNTGSNGNRSNNESETSCFPGLCPTCPAHWILIDNKCYLFSENKKSYDESERNCTESGSRLATVKEGGILRLVNFTGYEFWIGLTAAGTHYHGKAWTGRWADGSTETVSEGTGGGTCVKIGRRLILENCFTDLHWICERDTL
ncbi:C-type lectin domain family 2 member L-like [Mixophyes fleayi]|uniref:C-type lectin domain family 2 member L-like n=1 Tax=Mixophyes fleayi TaxID=3061075 RepID=UPI003F4D7728